MSKSLAYFASELRREFVSYCSQRLQPYSITTGLIYPIIYIGKHPNCAPKELIEMLHLDWGQGQRTLDRLVSDHLIRREKNPEDRRVSQLNLTEPGMELFRFSYELIRAWDQEKLSVLSPEEQEQLSSLLEKIMNQ